MKVHIIAVGRMKLPYAQAGCDEYLGRLKRLMPVTLVEVSDIRRRKGSDAQRWMHDEAEAIRRALPPGGQVVALDERGRQWDSRGFADWLRTQRDTSVPAVSFIIGGPDGLDPSIKQSAHRRWSLGQATMPHELARLVLAEQIYRAATLLRGMPYHRD